MDGDGRVDFGVYVPQIRFGYDEIHDRAQWIEELGFESLWLMDHLGAPGAPQLDSFEAWTLATALLATTRTLRVGHLVLANGFRHPVLLGKMATTLDVISGGRLYLGIGSGSIAAEHQQAGLPWPGFTERTARLAESLEIVTQMFTNPTTSFTGEHFVVHDVPNLPAPVQRPGPPIVIGGSGARTLAVAARYADMWNCVTTSLGAIDETLARVHAACHEADRDPASLRLSLEGVLVLAPDEDHVGDALALAERRYGQGFGLHELGLIGTPDVVVARLRALVDKGFSHFVFFMHDRAAREGLELFAEHVAPAFR